MAISTAVNKMCTFIQPYTAIVAKSLTCPSSSSDLLIFTSAPGAFWKVSLELLLVRSGRPIGCGRDLVKGEVEYEYWRASESIELVVVCECIYVWRGKRVLLGFVVGSHTHTHTHNTQHPHPHPHTHTHPPTPPHTHTSYTDAQRSPLQG